MNSYYHILPTENCQMCGFMSIEMIKRRYINNIFLYILKTDKKQYLTDKKLQMILAQESLFNLNATSPK